MALVDVDVVCVDLMKTLMFGGDRLEDWPAGTAPVMTALIARMARRYDDPASWADFPTLAEGLDGLAPPDQHAALVDAFAAREVGTVPPAHARAVRTLAAHRPVVLLSNIWAPPQRFEQALADAGLADVFTATVWSSVHRCVKPSPRLFQVALAATGVPPERVLMIGDDHARDIAPAAALGMQTAWVRSPQDVPAWVEAWCGVG